jgi:hypothetical protein
VRRAQEFRAPALLFVCVYLLHALMPVSLQGDSRWTIRTALSMIHSRTADLRDFAPAIVKSRFYLTECVGPGYSRQFPLSSLDQCAGGRLYAFNPVAVPVLAVPFVMVLEPAMHLMSPLLGTVVNRFEHPVLRAFLQGDATGSTAILEIIISSFFTAASVTVLYLAALELLPAASALILALTFGFGTLLWSLVSRALWQHSPSIFLNSLLILVLIRGDYRRRICFATGFILALAFFVRPTNAVTVVVIGAYLLMRLRSKVLWLFAGGAIPVLGFVAMNLDMYGSVLAPFFLPVRANSTSLSLHSEIGLALVSNLFSPARGMFVFMPFFLFLLIPGVWRQPIPGILRALRPWFCALIGLHMLLVATHTDWWGGYSYGPRYLVDMLPYLMILWSPALAWVGQFRLRQALLAVTLAVSLFIQFRGATSIKVHEWNSSPVSVNDDRHRIWDWSDPPFLRGLNFARR